MALVTPRTSPQSLKATNPTASLQVALKSFDSVLDVQQRQQFYQSFTQPKPDTSSVVVFITGMDARSQGQSGSGPCVSSRLCTFLEAVQQFTGVVDTFVSARPDIAALVWGGVKLTILIANNYMFYFGKVTRLIMEIGKACPVYVQYEQLFPSSIDLQQSLCEYYTTVVRLCIKIVEVLKRTTIKQLLSSITSSFDSEFQPIRDELNQAARDVQSQISLASKKAARDTAKLIEYESKENKGFRHLVSGSLADHKKERDEARQWRIQKQARETGRLRATMKNNLSSINHLKVWNHFHQQRAANTIEWLKHDQNYVNWISDNNTAILWCPGILGMGKTVLASHAVSVLMEGSHVQGRKDVICHHFCRTEDAASLSTQNILGTLTRQAIEFRIDHADFDRLLEMDKDTRDLDAQQLLDFLVSELDDDKTYYFVLDGLDEAETSHIRALAKHITNLCVRRPRNLKILCTGRPELEKELFKFINIAYRLPLTKSRVAPDVQGYSQAMLDECLDDGRLTLSDPTLIIKILQVLNGESDGIFLWMRLFLEEICVQQTDNDILQTLMNPPRKISELLDRKLTRVRRHEASAARLALDILKHCGVSKRPLTTAEMQELLSVAVGQQPLDRGSIPRDIDRLVAVCSGLVYVDEQQDTFHYVHHSVRLHFLNTANPTTFRRQDADVYLGHLCLTYLDFNDFKRDLIKSNQIAHVPVNAVQLGATPITQSNRMLARAAQKLLRNQSQLQTLSTREFKQKAQELMTEHSFGKVTDAQSRLFPFLQYAKTFWIYHLADLDPESDYEMWRLFCRTIHDTGQLVERPWLQATASMSDCPVEVDMKGIIRWSIRNENRALLYQAMREHWFMWDRPKALLEYWVDEIISSQIFSNNSHVKLLVLELGREIVDQAVLVTKFSRILESIPSEDSAMQTTRAPERSDSIQQNRNKISPSLHGESRSRTGDRSDYLHMLEVLILIMRNVNATDNIGQTGLQLAASGGHLDVVEMLLAAGASVNGTALTFEMTALRVAADKGRLDVVERLLAAGTDIDAVDRGGTTALQAAARKGHLGVVERLLSGGASINNMSYSGTTALQAAASNGHLNVVAMLLQAGANVHEVTALPVAASRGYLDVVEMLIAAGARVNDLGVSGTTALQAAADNGHLNIVAKLIQAGADVEITDRYKRSALRLAKLNRHEEIVRLLKTAGAKED